MSGIIKINHDEMRQLTKQHDLVAQEIDRFEKELKSKLMGTEWTGNAKTAAVNSWPKFQKAFQALRDANGQHGSNLEKVRAGFETADAQAASGLNYA